MEGCGETVGEIDMVGLGEGLNVGYTVGFDGAKVGVVEGLNVGPTLGVLVDCVGLFVEVEGLTEGIKEGNDDGNLVGSILGPLLG